MEWNGLREVTKTTRGANRHFSVRFAGTIQEQEWKKVASWIDLRLKTLKCVRWKGDTEDAREHVIRAAFHEVQSD